MENELFPFDQYFIGSVCVVEVNSLVFLLNEEQIGEISLSLSMNIERELYYIWEIVLYTKRETRVDPRSSYGLK